MNRHEKKVAKAANGGVLAPQCPYCGAKGELETNSAKYYKGRDFGSIWICKTRGCDSRVGCHRGTTRPLGRMANIELRKLRHQCHELIDPFWKNRKFLRVSVYKHIADLMGIPKKKAHIGIFNEHECRKLLELWKEPA